MKRSIISAMSLLLFSTTSPTEAQEQEPEKKEEDVASPPREGTPQASPASPTRDGATQASPTSPLREGAPQASPTSPPREGATQTSPKASPAKKKSEVVSVTGSRIKRTDREGPAPVQVVDKAQIEASGYNTVGEVLRELPVSSFGSTREEAGRGGAAVAGANLRGLGEEYTLVLIDGRRMPTDPILEFVDIGEIPVAMIERVEVLKEGASALYGSDAVGGVVNIITRKDMDGAGVLYSRTFTAEKGGDEQRIELVGGTGSDRTSVTVAASYRDRSIIMARDRKYRADGWSSSGNPGSFVPLTQSTGTNGQPVYKVKTGTGFRPDPACSEGDLNRVTVAGNNTYCEFNYGKTASIAPAYSQLGLMAKLDHELTDDIKIFGFIKDSRRSSRWNLAPSPQRFDVTDPTAVTNIKNLLGAAGDQIDPAAGDGVRIAYRTTELGTRDTFIQEKNSMGVLGFQGTFADWDWEYSFSKGRTWRHEIGSRGYWLIPDMQDLIKTGAYNPFDPNRDPGLLATAAHQPWSIEGSDLDTHNLIFTGKLGAMAGGPIGLAVGASLVEERYAISADSQTLQDIVAGSSASLGSGARSFRSLFAETSLPLTSALELGAALRFDDYSDVGSTTNPRLSVRYQLPSLLLRASAGTGFRAPSLQTINDGGGYGYPSFIDAVACQDAKNAGDQESIDYYCSQRQWEVRTAAAEDLKPEKTFFSNIGAVYELDRSFNLGLDLWFIRIKDRIDIPDYNLLTKAESEGNRGFEDAGIQITRDGGEIDYITLPNANLAKSEISGVDFNSNYALGDRATFQFTWGLDTSYYLYFKESVFEGQNLEDRIGIFSRPRWRANNAFNFAFARAHAVGFTARTIASTKKANPDKGTIPVHNEVDAQYTFANFGNGTIAVGAVNILNKEPPIDESQTPTIDVSLYSVLGRSMYVKLTQSF